MKVLLCLLLALTVLVVDATECSSAAHTGRVWYNACEERCVCTEITNMEGGVPVNDYIWECWRERKEITCMSTTERQRFLDAYKLISEDSSPHHSLKAQFDQLISRHSGNFVDIHSTQNFLPWHRWFALELENLLRQVDCRITLPWWDWSKVSSNPFNSRPWIDNPAWYGLDSNGACVNTGAFATWNPNFSEGCLRRDFSGTMPTAAQITNVLATSSGSWSTFSNDLESIHNTPHVRIGGTMVTGASPNAPEFFLHHGFIDQIWDRWQKQSAAHLKAYSFGMNTVMDWSFGTTVGEVNDLNNQKGCVKVRYVRYSDRGSGGLITPIIPSCLLVRFEAHWLKFDDVLRTLASAEREQLFEIPQTKFLTPSEDEQEHFMRMAIASSEGVCNAETKLKDLNQRFEANRKQVTAINEQRLNIVDLKQLARDDSQNLGLSLEYVAKFGNLKPAPEPYDADWADDEDHNPCHYIKCKDGYYCIVHQSSGYPECVPRRTTFNTRPASAITSIHSTLIKTNTLTDANKPSSEEKETDVAQVIQTRPSFFSNFRG